MGNNFGRMCSKTKNFSKLLNFEEMLSALSSILPRTCVLLTTINTLTYLLKYYGICSGFRKAHYNS